MNTNPTVQVSRRKNFGFLPLHALGFASALALALALAGCGRGNSDPQSLETWSQELLSDVPGQGGSSTSRLFQAEMAHGKSMPSELHESVTPELDAVDSVPAERAERVIRYQDLLRQASQHDVSLMQRTNKGNPGNAILNMAVFGDSLAAATFAGTVMGESLKFSDVWRVLRALSLRYLFPHDDPRFPTRLKTITGYEGYNSFSGSQDWSHRMRIAGLIGGEVGAYNYAVLGARTDHLATQVQKFAADFQYSPNAPAYIAISIGGNDFCDSMPVEKSLESLYHSIRSIRIVLPQSLVLISGIPDVVGVYKDYDRVAFRAPGFSMTCRQRAQMFPMCARELELISGDESRVAAAKQDLIKYQNGFREIAARIESQFPEEGPVRYAPLPAISGQDGLIAADCFHPGVMGHQTIATTTWGAVSGVFNFQESESPSTQASDQME